MSTTVRIIAEVELTVDTWDSKSSFDNLAQSAVREGRHVLETTDIGKGLRVIAVKEVKCVTHSIPWDKEPK